MTGTRDWKNPSTTTRDGVRVGSFQIPYALAVLAGALAYFGAASLTLATLQENASLVWPASGIALALLMLGGPRMAPAVFLGAFITNVSQGTAVPVVLAMAIGNTLEAMFAERLLRALPASRFARPIGWFTAATLAPVVSASFGVGAMALNDSFPSDSIAPIWLTWWMGDAFGIMLGVIAMTVRATDIPAIAEAEQLLSNAIASLSDGFAIYGADDRLQRCNSKYLPVSDLGGEQVCRGLPFEDILRLFAKNRAIAKDLDAWIAGRLAEHRAASGLPTDLRLDAKTWVRVTTQPIAGGGRAVTVSDISVIKLSEQRLKDAVNAMQDGFGLFDSEDRILFHNEAFMDEGSRKILGDDVTGRKFEEIVRAFAYHDMPEAADFDREAWVRARMERHNNPPKDAIEVTWSGGRVMRISERRTAEGGYVGTWTDITALKRAEQRLKDAIEALRDGFALFDHDDRLVICNEAFIDPKVKARIGDPRGHRFEDILRAHADGEEDAEAWIQQRMELHRRPPEKPLEIGLIDGRCLQVSERRTSDGGYVGTWTDITTIIGREQELRDVRDRLEQQAAELVELSENLDLARRGAETANRQKSQFLAHMSHELRTPLNAILGFSEMMAEQLMGPLDNPAYLQYAGIIHASGAHLLSLINDLLDISKIEAGKHELKITAIESAELARQSKRLVETLAQQRGITLEAAASDRCPVVQGDERAIKQILLNLLSNAIKFTPADGKVSLRIEPYGEREAAVIVSDTGIGMNEDEVRVALQPYGQIDSTIARQTRGTGLGLPLTKALTELHGGRLKIESNKGRGTTVTVTLPRCA